MGKQNVRAEKVYWSNNKINGISQVEKEHKSVGLEKKDTMNRARWRVGVREIAAGVNPATPVYGDNPDQNWIDDDNDFDLIFKNGHQMETRWVAKGLRTLQLLLQ